VAALLAMIHSYCCQFNSLNNKYVSIWGVIKNLFFYWQKPDHHKNFIVLVKVIKQECGGSGLLSHFLNMMGKEIEMIYPGIDMSKKVG